MIIFVPSHCKNDLVVVVDFPFITMTHSAITLLGGFQVSRHGRSLTGFQSNKARALLAYLATEAASMAHPPHRRAYLAGLFWPEWPDSEALAHLRHALANLRKVFEQTNAQELPLLVTRDTLQFNLESEYVVDVVVVMRCLQSLTTSSPDIVQLQQAVEQYQHSFLEGFYLNGCADFEEWMVLTREQLQRQIVDALRHLADHFEVQGDTQQARHYAQRRVELEPWLEEAHRQIMRLYALNGERSAALAHYERCRHQLAGELGVEPSVETAALYDAIRTGQFDKLSAKNVQLQNQKVKLEQHHPITQSPNHSVTNSRKHNLPAHTTPLLGRTRELTALQGLLRREEVRLVTLTGPGGVGKTRLGLAVAWQLLDIFGDGVFVTFLAAMREPALVLSAIAETLAVGEAGSRSLLERLVANLCAQRALLVLDNFEHLVVAAPVITELLAACPHLKVLVTSRERLRLQGEYEYVTPPLATPVLTTTFAPVALDAWPAVELFYQRAVAARHDFVLTAENASAIATICVRLDGLPLAIELAAARSKVFAPSVLLTRLIATNGDSSLQFLKTDTRDVPSRHRSLWDTIAWSYDLLDPSEQHLFRRLAVFVGGCTPEAVTAICCGDGDLVLDPLEGLATLVDKNLLQVEPSNELRFTMLETIREFGLAQLAAKQELAVIQWRHARYFAQWVAAQSPRLMGPKSTHAQTQIQAVYANVRVAFQWLLAQRDVTACLHLGNDLLDFWSLINHIKEAETYLQATLEIATGSPPSPAYVNTLASAGLVAFLCGRSDLARTHFEQCLAMHEQIDKLGNPKRIGVAHGLLAWIAFDHGNYATAHAHFAAAQASDLAANDEWALAMTLANWGKMYAALGDFERAEALLQEAFIRHRHIGQAWGIALTLTNQGYLYLLQRKLVEAAHVLAESQAICTEMKLVSPSYYLGLVTLDMGNYREARALLQEALRKEQEKQAPRYLLPILEALMRLAVKQMQFSTALTLAGTICAQRQQLKLVIPPVEKQLFAEAIATARRQLRAEVADAAWVEGEAITLDQAVLYALHELN